MQIKPHQIEQIANGIRRVKVAAGYAGQTLYREGFYLIGSIYSPVYSLSLPVNASEVLKRLGDEFTAGYWIDRHTIKTKRPVSPGGGASSENHHVKHGE